MRTFALATALTATLMTIACSPASAAPADQPATDGTTKKKIVFLPGPPSHGYGQHAHLAGCMLLARLLDEHVPAVQCVVVKEGWPKDASVFDGAAAIVISCDGGGIQGRHLAELDALMQKGIGLACLHYTVDVSPKPTGAKMLDWIGGYYEQQWSVNPFWDARFTSLPEHPITRGVKPFHISDEWYYHMRFRTPPAPAPGNTDPETLAEGLTPILAAIPPDSTRKGPDGAHSGNPAVRARIGLPETVAWAYQRPDAAAGRGGRGFGFTGMHVHWNWAHDQYRKVVLNALLWIAHVEVPAEGVVTKTPTLEELEANQGFPRPADFKAEQVQRMMEGFNK